MPTKLEISAGGVALRELRGVVEVALISVGESGRWQLPKGLVDTGESTEDAALREVREEAGIATRPLRLIDKIEYWYVSGRGAERTRIHKFVYFYLLEYESGSVEDHDLEVNEARWAPIDEAIEMLSFESERKIVERAKGLITA